MALEGLRDERDKIRAQKAIDRVRKIENRACFEEQIEREVDLIDLKKLECFFPEGKQLLLPQSIRMRNRRLATAGPAP